MNNRHDRPLHSEREAREWVWREPAPPLTVSLARSVTLHVSQSRYAHFLPIDWTEWSDARSEWREWERNVWLTLYHSSITKIRQGQSQEERASVTRSLASLVPTPGGWETKSVWHEWRYTGPFPTHGPLRYTIPHHSPYHPHPDPPLHHNDRTKWVSGRDGDGSGNDVDGSVRRVDSVGRWGGNGKENKPAGTIMNTTHLTSRVTLILSVQSLDTWCEREDDRRPEASVSVERMEGAWHIMEAWRLLTRKILFY